MNEFLKMTCNIVLTITESLMNMYRVMVKGWKNLEESRIIVLVSDKIDFKPKTVKGLCV